MLNIKKYLICYCVCVYPKSQWKKTINLKESSDGYMGGLGGRKDRGISVIIKISTIKEIAKTLE